MSQVLEELLSCPCRRLAVVELFSEQIFHSETIVGILKSCEDLERIIQKVCTRIQLPGTLYYIPVWMTSISYPARNV